MTRPAVRVARNPGSVGIRAAVGRLPPHGTSAVVTGTPRRGESSHIEPEDGDPPPRATLIGRHPGLQLRKLLAESFPATGSLVAGELDGVDARCRLVDD